MRHFLAICFVASGCIESAPQISSPIDAAAGDTAPYSPDLATDFGQSSDADVSVSRDLGDRGELDSSAMDVGVDMPATPCPNAGVPLARWAMDTEANGIVPNTGSGGAPGLNMDGASLQPGRVGSFLRVEGGATGSPHVPDHPDFDLDAGTVSAWFVAENDANAGIVSRDASNSTQNGHWRITTASGNVAARLQSTADELRLSDAGPVVVSRWTHVALSWQAGETVLYVNGSRVDEAAAGWTVAGNDNPIGIGYDTSSTSEGAFEGGRDFLTGGVDEVTLWDRVLTEREVRELAEIDCTTPVAN